MRIISESEKWDAYVVQPPQFNTQSQKSPIDLLAALRALANPDMHPLKNAEKNPY